MTAGGKKINISASNGESEMINPRSLQELIDCGDT